MKVLFCGGRDFNDVGRVREVFDKLEVTVMAHGMARGADTLCSKEAERRGIPQICFPANWRGEGNTAGPARNARMLEFFRPDLVVAFPGGTGTEHMVKIAKAAGVKVRRARA